MSIINRSEVEWLYQSGASQIFPDYWEDFVAPIPEVSTQIQMWYKTLTHSLKGERDNLIEAYYHRLTGNDSEVSNVLFH